MNETVLEVVRQLSVAIPVIIVATQTLTSILHGMFKIQNSNAVHALSWVIAILTGLCYVYTGKLMFGFEPVWNYVLGGVTGLISGGAANGLYDWPAIKKIFDWIEALFTINKKS